MEDLEVVWLSGLLEGEGWFGADERRGCCYAMLQVNMADRDVILRAAEIMRRISGSTAGVTMKKTYQDTKEQWRFSLAGAPAELVMRAILPHMGVRRSERIQIVLDKISKQQLR